MLGLPIGQTSSLLALTLANTGQLIHPGIMYALFATFEGTPFGTEDAPLFYQGLSQEGARTLADLSDDIQAIRTRLQTALDLSAVRPLFDWLLQSYGDAIADPSTLYSAFVTNRAYSGLAAPVREAEPDQARARANSSPTSRGGSSPRMCPLDWPSAGPSPRWLRCRRPR